MNVEGCRETPDLATVVGLEQSDLVALIERLRNAGDTVAIAESLTAGLTLAVLTEVPGASAVIRGGLVVYATNLKHELAGVDSALLARVGAVDPDVAAALADGVRLRCASSIGLGLTGVAGPDPQDGISVGTVFVALSTVDAEPTVIRLDHPGTRSEVRAVAVRAAVGLLEAQSRRQRGREHNDGSKTLI